MIVYRRFAVRRYAYGGSGIVDTVGSLLARYAICWLQLQRQHCVVAWLEKAVAGSHEPQSKKASVDTGGIDINALIDVSGIVLE